MTHSSFPGFRNEVHMQHWADQAHAHWQGPSHAARGKETISPDLKPHNQTRDKKPFFWKDGSPDRAETSGSIYAQTEL